MSEAAVGNVRDDCPFPGLRSFTADEAHLFFGREGQSDTIVTLLARGGFVAIVGTSGCGKSSLLRAGVLPSLLAGYAVKLGSQWLIADCRPGSDPMRDVARKLGPLLGVDADPEWLRQGSSSIVDAVQQARARGAIDAEDNVLIVVDQFEELFRYRIRDSDAADRDVKAEFVALLLRSVQARANRIFVALTMRSDFLGDCAQFRDLPEQINGAQYLVPRLTRQQRRAAIEGPIRVAAAAITPRLVARLLNELGDDQDQLPVLQHSLMRTWDAWVERKKRQGAIDVDDYERIGSLRDALGEHAEEVLRDVQKKLGDDAGLTIVKRIFQRLRTRDANGREIRSPATVQELIDITGASLEDVRTVLDAFRDDVAGRTFVVPMQSDQRTLEPATSIDITHESLIRNWPRMTSVWVREEEDDRRIYTRLAERAEEEGATPQAFLRGSVLQRTAEWWDDRKPNGSWAARYHTGFQAADGYLQASREMLKQEQRQKDEERRAAEQRRVDDAKRDAELKASTFKKRAAYAGILVTAIMLIGILISFFDARRAQQAATAAGDLARDAQRNAVTQLLASKSALAAHDGGPALLSSLLLAATSLARSPTVEAQSLASSALALMPPLVDWPAMTAADLMFGSGGDALALLGEDRQVRIWSVTRKSEVGRLPAEAVQEVTLARLAARAVTAGSASAIQVWNVSAAAKLADLSCASATQPRISDDGNTVAALCDGRLLMWRTKNDWAQFAAVQRSRSDSTSRWTHLSLAPDAEAVALARMRAGPRVADYDELDVRQDALVVVEDAESGRELARLPVDDNSVTAIEVFGRSYGLAIAVGDTAGGVRAWDIDVEARRALELDKAPPAGTTKLPGAITALRQGVARNTLIAGSRGGLTTVWSDAETARIVGESGVKSASVTGPNGHAAVVDTAGHVHVWDLGAMEDTVPVPGQVATSYFSADGSLMLYRGRAGSLSGIVDVTKGRILRTWRIQQDGFYLTAISPDKRTVAVRESPVPGERGSGLAVRAYEDGKIGASRWTEPVVPAGTLTAYQFSHDSKRLAAFAAFNPALREQLSPDARLGLFVWDVETGRELLHVAAKMPRAVSPYCFAGTEPRILIASADGLLEASLTDKQQVPSTLKAVGRVTRMACSPNGTRVAVVEVTVATAESSAPVEAPAVPKLRVLEYPSGRELRSLDLVSTVRSIAFDVTGRFLTMLDDASVSVWNLESPERPLRIPTRSRTITAILGAQGQLATATQRGLTYLRWWPPDLVREACRRAGRDLTQREWESYMGSEPRTSVCAQMR